MFWTINFFGDALDGAPVWAPQDGGICEECGSFWHRPRLNGNSLCKRCLALLDGLNEEETPFWGNGTSEEERS